MRCITCAVNLFTLNHCVTVYDNGTQTPYYCEMDAMPELALQLAVKNNIDEINVYNNAYAENIVGKMQTIKEVMYADNKITINVLDY